MPSDVPSAQKDAKQITPEVTWAQRSSTTDAEKNFVYLTISVPDVSPKEIKLDLQPGSVSFTGYSESKKATYHVEIPLYADIDPAASKVNHSARDVEMKLQKKELKEEYWPRLLKESKRMHWLKTDFDKWVDEDEQNGDGEDDYMSQFGGQGMGDGGFGGLDFSKLGGGAGGMPDLSSLGGAGGMGGDDEDDEDEDEDDEEMPDLGDDAKAGSSKKIEEVA